MIFPSQKKTLWIVGLIVFLLLAGGGAYLVVTKKITLTQTTATSPDSLQAGVVQFDPATEDAARKAELEAGVQEKNLTPLSSELKNSSFTDATDIKEITDAKLKTLDADVRPALSKAFPEGVKLAKIANNALIYYPSNVPTNVDKDEIVNNLAEKGMVLMNYTASVITVRKVIDTANMNIEKDILIEFSFSTSGKSEIKVSKP